MERHPSAIKAARQSEKRRAANRQVRSRFKGAIKDIRQEIAEYKTGKNPEEQNSAQGLEKLQAKLRQVQKIVMTAAGKNQLSRKTAARYISRLSHQLHFIKATPVSKQVAATVS